MKIQENLDKIFWSFADKVTYIVYGFVTLIQVRYMEPADFGLFGMLIGLHTWIFVVSDSLALNNVVQFGTFVENQRKVNLFSLLLHLAITITAALLVFLSGNLFVDIFHDSRFVNVGYSLPILTLLSIPRTFCLKLIFRERAFFYLFLANLSFFGTMSVITFYMVITLKHITFFNIMDMYYLGTIVSSLVSILLTFRHLKFGFKGNVSYRSILKFSVPLSMVSTLHSLPKNLDTYLIKLFFPLSTIGVYNSAKTLFRLFDEANTATYGLLYPVAVRQIEFKNYKNLNDMMTKALSVIMNGTLFLVLVLEFGGSSLVIKSFLPASYFASIGQFNLLLIAALFLPFIQLSSIITAFGKPKVILNYCLVSVILAATTFIIVGNLNLPGLIPLGIIIYTITLGTLCFNYVHRNLNFEYKMLFRVYEDSFNFLKNRRKK